MAPNFSNIALRREFQFLTVPGKMERSREISPIKEASELTKKSLNLSNPNLSYLGLTPSAQYLFLDHDANIEMFRVRSDAMFIRLTDAF